jgi:ribonuclease BN (tRNA processing enzyme)
MKIFFLGTNGWYDTGTGNTVCVLIDSKDGYFIFDAGNGLYKIDKYIKKDKPIYLFLSHFHLDHVIGFHILNKFNFKQGIDVFGPAGLKKLFSQVISSSYSLPISALKTKVRLHEIINPYSLPQGIECRPLKHSVFCYGYRLSSENKTVSYCTDTGVCKNLYFLAKNSDLFITECSYKSGQVDKAWPHLNPESAAKVAFEAQAKRMALVHFDSSLYLTLKDRNDAEMKARFIFRNTFAAIDDTKLELK